ncbi:unnamed protein product [Bemisia tabaci]|uniref:Ionotropic receptor n=1 Tax=Bemisia tabaci TaxID=7038 RepID=A0A9P0AI04_BEMTA|nr:unnamed protein product [Bemisia tabaci]
MDQICDERMFISSDELIGSSVLSDQNFNLTRDLYTNPIWNSKNYLIFMLNQDLCHSPTCVLPPTQSYVQNLGNKTLAPYGNDAMIFCFKFFWRFFRGLKTIICYKEIGCSRYDPFTENILWYDGGKNEPYFEFSVTNMHKKTLRLMLADYEGDIVMDWYLENWMQTLLDESLAALTESLNCTTKCYVGYASYSTRKIGHEIGQKFDIDLHQVELGATKVEVDYSKFDFSVGVETEAICVLTPHSKLVPQCLVPFKVFTVPVWIFIVITVAAFVSTQHIFLHVHSGCLHGLYSEREISLFHNFSSVYTMYAYFICGSPPRLLLGRLFTGKILFLIFIFSALIISTIFLGGMTTLLTNTVHYPEIDTLKDLEGSDLSIQVKDIEAAGTYFAQLGLSEEMRAKLTCSLDYYTTASEWFLIEQNIVVQNLFRGQDIGNETGYDSEPAMILEQFTKNVHAIMEEDAFLVSLPRSLDRSGNKIILTRWPAEKKVEYHLVPECLKSNSYFFTFMKNSFWFDAFNRKAAQFLETGLVGKTFEHIQFIDQPEVAPPPPKEDEPRPYSLNDLQLPFLSLVLGLLLSLIVFVAEMVVEDFENVAVIRKLRHFKKYLFVKKLIRK